MAMAKSNALKLAPPAPPRNAERDRLAAEIARLAAVDREIALAKS